MKRALLLCLAVAACGEDAAPKYTVERLQDPGTCMECHPKHYAQWSGSMHAYAIEDPVFRAMHARGQRETGGALGLFCVNCHAPMAVRNGTITEANVATFDLATLSPAEDGVTCYFCHNIESVVTDHNAQLEVAMDQTMRGGLQRPVESPAHHSAYDQRMDSERNSSELCGACHDVITPAGVHLERTFAEWKGSVFGASEDPTIKLTCGNCHMEPTTDVVADNPALDVPLRPLGVHDHMFPAIDQALTPFPRMAEQAAAIDEILRPSLAIVGPRPRTSTRAPGGICLDPPGTLTVRVDSFNVGHSFPSGVAHDRRAWVEVIAYRADGTTAFESGVVPDQTDPDEIGDPNLFGIWDRTYKDSGAEAHFFWEAARTDPAWLIKGPVTFDANDPAYDHSRTHTFANLPNIAEFVRITARVRIRALPFVALRMLVESGDLDPAILDRVPTLEVTDSEWLRSTAGTGVAQFTNCNPD